MTGIRPNDQGNGNRNDNGNGSGSGWIVTLDDGTTLHATHVVLAMGMRYDVPDIPGIEPLWGASVFHSPFCHGWEHRGQPLLILAGGPQPAERALLLRNWSRHVTVIAPPDTLPGDDRTLLSAAGVPVIDSEVVGLKGREQTRELEAAELADGTVMPARGLLVPAPHRQRSGLAGDLGVALDESDHVVVDATGRSSVEGVWAVGDLTTPMALVAHAAATGAVAATWIVRTLSSSSDRASG